MNKINKLGVCNYAVCRSKTIDGFFLNFCFSLSFYLKLV